MKGLHISIAAIAGFSLLCSSCVVPYDGYGTFSYSTNGYNSTVAWTSASYDANGFPIYGYSYGRPVYGYTTTGAAIFTIGALTALCFVPNWGPAPWYHGHWHYPPHIHRCAVPPHYTHGHRPGVRPPGGMHAPIHHRPHEVMGGHKAPSHAVSHRPHNDYRPNLSSRPDKHHRPNLGNRPGNDHRPNLSNRPGNDHRPNLGSRPGNGIRPNVGNRPGNDRRPNLGSSPGNDHRPNVGNRPGNDHRPNLDSRPNLGSRPNIGSRPSPSVSSSRPSMSSRPSPSISSRPSVSRPSPSPSISSRPSSRPSFNRVQGATRPAGMSGHHSGGRGHGGGRRR